MDSRRRADSDIGLSESVVQRSCTVFPRHRQVVEAILNGSRAKGSCRKGSDIDLTVCGGEDLTLRVRHRIADELDDLLLPYTINLSILRDTSDPDVLQRVERVAVALYERQQELIDEEGGGWWGGG